MRIAVTGTLLPAFTEAKALKSKGKGQSHYLFRIVREVLEISLFLWQLLSEREGPYPLLFCLPFPNPL